MPRGAKAQDEKCDADFSKNQAGWKKTTKVDKTALCFVLRWYKYGAKDETLKPSVSISIHFGFKY